MHTTIKALVAALALTATTAGATVLTQTQTQTADYQDFTFSLTAPGYVTNTASKLTFTVQGDFNDAIFGEQIIVFIDGVNRGTFGYASPEAYGVIDYRTGTANYNALQFSVDLLLSGAETSGFLADGVMDVKIDFDYGVNVNCGWSNASNCLPNVGAAPFAQVNFDYVGASTAVPEPASLALFGLGLAGFAAARRRNAKQA